MKYLLDTVKQIQYFTFKFPKRTFEKNSHEIGSIKYVPRMKKSIKHSPINQTKYLKQTFEKSHTKSGSSLMALV